MHRESLQPGITTGRKLMTNNNDTSRSTIVNKSRPTTTKNSSMNRIHLSRRVQHAITGLVLLIISYILPPYPHGFILLTLATAAFYHVHLKRVHDEVWDKWYLDGFGTLLRDHERGEWEGNDGISNTDIINDGRIASNKQHNNKQQQPIHDSSSTYNNKPRRRKTIPALPGAFYFLLGTSLSTLLFPTVVARTSLLVLSIADPMAGLVGAWCTDMGWNITWNRLLFLLLRIRKRDGCSTGEGGGGGPSIAGSIACAGSTILCIFFYMPFNGMDDVESTIPAGGFSLSFSARVCIGILTALTEAIAGRHLPVIGTMLDDNLLIPLVVGNLICWLSQ